MRVLLWPTKEMSVEEECALATDYYYGILHFTYNKKLKIFSQFKNAPTAKKIKTIKLIVHFEKFQKYSYGHKCEYLSL